MPLVTKRAAARRDLVEQFVYLAENAGLNVAERFLSPAEASFADLARQPMMGAPVTLKHPDLAGMRKWRVKDFDNYLVFYQPRSGGVSIVRVCMRPATGGACRDSRRSGTENRAGSRLRRCLMALMLKDDILIRDAATEVSAFLSDLTPNRPGPFRSLCSSADRRDGRRSRSSRFVSCRLADLGRRAGSIHAELRNSAAARWTISDQLNRRKP